MTRRPLLWITACAVALGAATASPLAADAQEGLATWRLTVDDPGGGDGVTESKALTITGSVTGVLAPSQVTVIVDRGTSLPDACGPVQTFQPIVDEGRYHVDLTVPCNGPYQIRVTGGEGPFAQTATTTMGVAEMPQPPAVPPDFVPTSDGGLTVTWDRSTDVDAAGWILVVGADDVPLPADTHSTVVPAANAGETVALKSQRWGAGGPGTDVLTSDPGPGAVLTKADPGKTSGPPSSPPPASPPPSGGRDGGGGAPSPPGSSPPTSGATTPTRGTGSDATLPAGYTEEIPYGVADDAFVPGDAPSADATDGEEESAAGTSPSAGLVRIGGKSSPGLVAPFALALLMITIAAHITWYLRRSKPTATDGGQVTLH